MKLSILQNLCAAALALMSAAVLAAPTVVVYKTPTCGCCSSWIEHMKSNGFMVNAVNVSDVSSFRRHAGVPDYMASCHTAMVDGYAIEGHVPAADVKRLLAERPKARGLAVPGMPQSAPGMDAPGRTPYEVLLIDTSGKFTVYQRH